MLMSTQRRLRILPALADDWSSRGIGGEEMANPQNLIIYPVDRAQPCCLAVIVITYDYF